MSGGMINCAACLRRAVQASSRSRPLAEAAGIWASLPPQTGRRYASVAAPSTSVAAPSTSVAAPSTERADAPRTLTLEPLDSADSQKKDFERLQRIVKKHLQHMDDPWKIAQYVEDALAKDRFDEALLLTKTAGKDRQVVVAWNHLINYLLDKQQLKNAIKLYNDMKKRGQLPNVQTFTIIFRGCAKSQHPKLAVSEAVKHYNLLLSDKRLQPNSIHMNAVLNVCARAGDLDSMFLIAETANESTRAPTSYTYTTILNALRYQAMRDMEDVTPEQQAANAQKAVDRAKSIWAEVIDKWRKAQLVIDEELVCSMGRVLLLAPVREDKREVLELLYQTMSIPNLAKDTDSDAFQDGQMEKIAVTGVAKKVPSSRAVYAVPGRNTLALILTTLASSKLTTCGIKYWNLLVRHYGVVPDNDNWLRMFGMLKVAKASGHASSILSLLPDEYIDGKHYRIAMETCVRDNINTNAIANANRVLDSMLTRLPVPDLHSLRLYLRVALVSHYQFRERMKNGDEKSAKREYGLQITTALAHLWEPYKKVHYHYFKGESLKGSKLSPGELYNSQREVIALARHMFSAFNKVINEKMLPEDDAKELRVVGAKINREIQKFYSDRDDREPNLRKSGRGVTDESLEEEETDENSFDAGFRPGGDFVWNTTKQAEEFDERQSRRSWGAKEGDERQPRRSWGAKEGDERRPRRSWSAGDERQPRRTWGAKEGDERQPRRTWGAMEGDEREPRRSWSAKEGDERQPRRSWGAKEGDERQPRRTWGAMEGDEREPRRSWSAKEGDERQPRRSWGAKEGDERQPRRSWSTNTR